MTFFGSGGLRKDLTVPTISPLFSIKMQTRLFSSFPQFTGSKIYWEERELAQNF